MISRPRISGGAVMIAIIIIAIIVGSIAWLSSEVVPAGHVGVYDLFGQVEDQEYHPGFYFINPLANIHAMNIQTQQYEYAEIRKTLTKEGLEVIADVSVTWHIEPEKASDIYKTVAGNYFDTLITPSFMGIFRDEVKKWTAEDIYTGRATEIQNDVEKRLRAQLSDRGIVIESVWLRGNKFDPKVEAAISSKLTEKQEAEKMEFTVQKQTLESQRLVIEYQGRADANKVYASSLTPEILTQSFIDAIKNNPNVIYVPIGGGQGSGFNMIVPQAAPKN